MDKKMSWYDEMSEDEKRNWEEFASHAEAMDEAIYMVAMAALDNPAILLRLEKMMGEKRNDKRPDHGWCVRP